MKINIKYIPDNTIKKYNLNHLIHNNHVLVKLHKTIYGLPEAGRIAQEKLYQHLEKYDYYASPDYPGIIKHKTRNIMFSLVVDDFGIKYSLKEDATHLINALRDKYDIKINWEGNKYVGFTILKNNWNDNNRSLSISMPNYVKEHLEQLNIQLIKQTDSPAIYTPPSYGKQTIVDEKVDEDPICSPENVKYLQRICGIFLYYARAVDPTMLTAIGKIAANIANPTQSTLKAAEHFLQYAASHPDATMTFKPSDMQLKIISDASFAGDSQARSRAGGVHFLCKASELSEDDTLTNAPFHYFSTIIPTIVTSAAEAEYAALFLNGKDANYEMALLEYMGYPQTAITIICDNSCAAGTANRTVKPKRSKSFDIKFHWIRKKVDDKIFKIIWKKGETNEADYLTKILPIHQYRDKRYLFLSNVSKP